MDFRIEYKIESSQCYRRNSVAMDCKRHMDIFNQFSIIPEACFSCYKVQFLPRSFIELLRLYLIFDRLELQNQNIRKCMIELRPNIPGFYKGIIYCSTIEDAEKIKRDFESQDSRDFDPKLPIKLKRGCSEYPALFPDYGNLYPSNSEIMKYEKGWRRFENDYDERRMLKNKNISKPSFVGINVHDALVFQKWYSYGKGIGDPSVNNLNCEIPLDLDVYQAARARLNA